MALTKIPIPLLIAAFVATTATVIILQLTVVPVPPVVDSGFNGTLTLVKGSPYLWRASASEISISSNATLKLTYMPLFHVIHINGPLSNASLGENKWMIYYGNRAILVERVTTPDGTTHQYLLKLVNVSKVNGLTVLVPQTFSVYETINDEARVIQAITGRIGLRVVNVYTNGTHIALDVAAHNSTTVLATHYFRLPPAVETTHIIITSSGYGVSYKVGNVTVSAYVMPYQHIVIVPNATARVVIVVR